MNRTRVEQIQHYLDMGEADKIDADDIEYLLDHFQTKAATPAPVSREVRDLLEPLLTECRRYAELHSIEDQAWLLAHAVVPQIQDALTALSPAPTAPARGSDWTEPCNQCGGLGGHEEGCIGPQASVVRGDDVERALRGLMLAANTAYLHSASQGYRMRADGAEALDTMKLVMEQIKERVQIDWTGSADLSEGEKQ